MSRYLLPVYLAVIVVAVACAVCMAPRMLKSTVEVGCQHTENLQAYVDLAQYN